MTKIEETVKAAIDRVLERELHEQMPSYKCGYKDACYHLLHDEHFLAALNAAINPAPILNMPYSSNPLANMGMQPIAWGTACYYPDGQNR